jgi:transposase InsO family protein
LRVPDRDAAEPARGKIVARLDWEDEAALVRWSIRQGEKKRRPPTDDQKAVLRREPKLDHGTYEFARAYALLSSERSNGMGIGPIRIRAIWEWLDRAGIQSPLIRRHAENVIMAVDGLTLRKSNRPQSAAPANSEHVGLQVPDRGRRKSGKPRRRHRP